MSLKTPDRHGGKRRIMGRIEPEEFVGRANELQQIVRLASNGAERRGLLIMAAPAAGLSELLRQAYDELFRPRGNTVPVYFNLTRNDKTPAGAAERFLHLFLQHVIAFRRRGPSQNNASLSLTDLLELASPADEDWIGHFIEATERARAGGDERAFIRLCLGAPQRAAAHGVRSIVMLDDFQVAGKLEGEVDLCSEIAQAFTRSTEAFVLGGLRRQLSDVLHDTRNILDPVSVLRLECLGERDARLMVEYLSRRTEVATSDQTRDLIVQQCAGKPFFINALFQAAREGKTALNSFLHCQQLYIDELMGGRIHRHFNSILEEIAPQPATRRGLVRVLYESAAGDGGKASVETWRKRLGLEGDQFRHVLHRLHLHELITLNANFVEMGTGPSLWKDYLQTRYRLEVAGDPRALVVAETLIDALKRAPQTMARHYRRETALNLRDLLARFDCQRVPASLLHYDRFSRLYKGAEADAITAGLDAETDLVSLPQVIATGNCASFYPPMRNVCDEERCAIAHGFTAGNYTDANEVVWLAIEIESKLEAGRGITEVWCDRLTNAARACGWNRVRLWLVATEGFTDEANELLAARHAYSSSRRQLELLTARISAGPAPGKDETAPDEFELVIPMGDDTELIAASTVDQIARRVAFQPEAINQIKTALVEACINATEHSLSPDRKIYQRFRVESDKLVMTVSSRGVVPPDTAAQNSINDSHQNNGGGGPDAAKGRRGWGLKLIRMLMDEVEFERVDDGTSLRMTKYLKKQ